MSDTITARIGNEATVVRNEATDSGVKVPWDGEGASVEIRVEGIVENVAVTMMTREKRQDQDIEVSDQD